MLHCPPQAQQSASPELPLNSESLSKPQQASTHLRPQYRLKKDAEPIERAGSPSCTPFPSSLSASSSRAISRRGGTWLRDCMSWLSSPGITGSWYAIFSSAKRNVVLEKLLALTSILCLQTRATKGFLILSIFFFLFIIPIERVAARETSLHPRSLSGGISAREQLRRRGSF